jgi:hypothetical protein
MAYIKISDPNVIDVAAWQQVINVVNQHSDSITAITNNFGIQGTGETNWSGDSDLSHEYDPGSQKIVFGKNKVTTAEANSFLSDDNKKHVYYGSVVFYDEVSGAKSFGATPIVTASIQFSNQTTTMTGANIVLTVQTATETGFTYRVTDSRSTKAAGVPITATQFYINWMAIGPK